MLSARKVKTMLRTMDRINNPEKYVSHIRDANQVAVTNDIQQLHDRLEESIVEKKPFHKDIENVQKTLTEMQSALEENKSEYNKHFTQVHEEIERVRKQQDKQEESRMKQNHLLTIKANVIALEKKIALIRPHYRPRFIEPLENRLSALKKKYQEILQSDATVSDVPKEVLTQEHSPEMAQPITAEKKPDLPIDKIREEILKASSDNFDLPDVLTETDTLELPSPIPHSIPMPAPPPPESVANKDSKLESGEHKDAKKGGFLSTFFHKKK